MTTQKELERRITQLEYQDRKSKAKINKFDVTIGALLIAGGMAMHGIAFQHHPITFAIVLFGIGMISLLIGLIILSTPRVETDD